MAPDRYPAVLFRAVTKSYGPVRALSTLDLCVAAGSFVALTGGNGTGKSTVLRLAGGLSRPDAGVVRVDGWDPRTAPPRLRGRVGLLTHDSGLYPDLTVRENLVLHGRLFRTPAGAVPDMVEALDLGAPLNRPVRELSRGTRQRAALARALLHGPDIVLLDEPYTGLDAGAVARLTALLARILSDGATIIAALHDLTPVDGVRTRLVELAAGRIHRDVPNPVAVQVGP